MSEPTLHALLAWNRTESRRWHTWFRAHPPALGVWMGRGSRATVRTQIHHVFAVDLRYAQRLVGLPVSTIETLDVRDLDGLFALGERAHALLAGWLTTASEADLDRLHSFTTLSAGERTASARKIVIHACTHHVRHWAQIATVLRIHGHPSDWTHDFFLSEAMP
jgi:uncharacterized damage-inducible protein DinB